MASVDLSSCVVDFGAGFTKWGVAGDFSPSTVEPSVTSSGLYRKVLPSASDSSEQ